MLVLVLLLTMLPLTGCSDDLLGLGDAFEALEERAEALEDRMYEIEWHLDYEQSLIFEQRMEQALEAFEKSVEADVVALMGGEVTYEELEMMSEAEILELLNEESAASLIEMLDHLIDQLHVTMDEVEHALLPYRKTIRLTIDEAEGLVNGRIQPLDQAPVITDGRTLVPLRFIGEALGAAVEWSHTDRRVTYTLGDQVLQLTINSNEANLNGQTITLETAPVIAGGRTLVPLRFVGETLGFEVEWVGSKRMVVITTPFEGVEDPWSLPPEPPAAVSYLHGVVVDAQWIEEDPVITLLVNGEEETYEVHPTTYWDVVEDWDYYSHWGLFQAGFSDEMILVSLEYLEGVAEYVGIFADYEDEKTLADVLALEGNLLTFIGVEHLLDSDDPDALAGFDTIINTQLTPANGETIQLSDDVVVYVEGEDGLFQVGDPEAMVGDAYDYVELYDIDGDLVYDIVIVWLI
ncbi:Copper amine oxidase N-terminal domain-containing protein [Anoxynatronum buryatiense]|uniref:Copper amine oxidase N-terminal domain-containing protein n=1 Tax=Anoxynatronum buryatiense TaxID=489973 RepID=A0AA46AJ71_9CLOT|nr:Copper amine oxidase N-terminal domain-containing protein [Anoxynatronum buryatiense]